MCLTSRERGSVSCNEGTGGPSWLSLSGKSDHALWEAWERECFLQRTRRLAVEKSQWRATLHAFTKFRAIPRQLSASP